MTRWLHLSGEAGAFGVPASVLVVVFLVGATAAPVMAATALIAAFAVAEALVLLLQMALL